MVQKCFSFNLRTRRMFCFKTACDQIWRWHEYLNTQKLCHFKSFVSSHLAGMSLQGCLSFYVLQCWTRWGETLVIQDQTCQRYEHNKEHHRGINRTTAVTCDLKACSSAWSSAIFSSCLTAWLCASCRLRNSSSNWKEKQGSTFWPHKHKRAELIVENLNSCRKTFGNNIHSEHLSLYAVRLRI